MGGANSIVNVFDINNYNKSKLTEQALKREASFEEIDENEKQIGQSQTRKPFGAEMLSFNDKKESEREQSTALDDGRLKNFNDYEIQKYMQKNIKPIHMPDMPTYMRAEDQDPGQSSPRS